MTSKRITLAAIAEACGVSKTVVSLALNHKTHPAVRYSEATAQRIRSTAKDMGYRPIRASRAHFGGRHRAYGLLISNLHEISSLALQTIHRRTAEHGCMLSIESFQRSDRDLPVLVAENVVDGLLVFEEPTAEIQQAIDTAKLPCVLINTNRQRGNGVIVFDELGGMQVAVQTLMASGANHLALFRNRSDEHRSFFHQRLEGFQQACRDAATTESLVYDYHRSFRSRTSDPASLLQELTDWLRAHPQIDGIICHSLAASRVYRAAQALGRRIPEDLQVIGIGADLVCEHLIPSLSHIAIDQVQLGRQAVEHLEALIEGKRQPRLLMPYAFKARGSTR